ncbi:hypothetical protein [Gynurincola endophyticus]|uniref:hypothetical protein n=1 Tax=Gynurincola endophyticus TaxID=2479004 RepID=UPI000F8EA307|nr:hypothetical protein [Gynurincola endophyticus]
MNNKFLILLYSLWALVLVTSGCTKVEYTKVENPAYLRVFNNFNYGFTLGEKDVKVPFLCMLINPEYGADGKIKGAEIVGDFLDIRNSYAPPYPSHIGSSTSVNNPEYPGKENVLVAPIVNGYDLSSWAQIPSGNLRFVFLYRPKNDIPYFQLEGHLKDDIMLDTTVSLTASEVYTMHLLQKDFQTKENGLLLRQEIFHKLPLSDELVYTNFYNYSAKGFVQSPDDAKPKNFRNGKFQYGIQDKMDIYLTIYPDENLSNMGSNYRSNALKGYNGVYLTTIERNSTSDAVAPYINFPLFANPADDKIKTASWQSFDFFRPGINPTNNTYFGGDVNTGGNWAVLNCYRNGQGLTGINSAGTLPNMLVSIHSGTYNPRTFATVNTVEVVNGGIYMMTVQRKYPAPSY